MNSKYFIAGALSVLVVIAISVGGFLLGRGGSELPQTSEPSPTSGPSLKAPDTLREDVAPTPIPGITAIIVAAAISNQNYSALESFMADPVSVRLEASGCCQPMTPEEAAQQLEYLNNAEGTWDFDQSNPVVNDLQASYPENYANAIVGISSDNYVAAFQLNDSGKIAKISMAIDYELLLP